MAMSSDTEKLQKVLAAAGIASRRRCEELIEDGLVTVNGDVAHLGMRVDASSVQIEIEGTRVSVAPGLVHYLLNKPVGVLSSASDPHGRALVVDLVPSDPRVFPVGRLDRDSEGLLILTNNGMLTQQLTHPSFGVPKEYLVQYSGTLGPQALRHLRQGIELEDGRTAPARVSTPGPNLLRMVIHEGRNRQIRRMVAAVGGEVQRLVRTRIGPITDTNLAPGAWRVLTLDEIHELERAISSTGMSGPHR